MTSITEQLSATGKSQLETQLNLMDAVLRKSVEGVQQVTALNLHTARNVFERSTNSARELLAAKDAREILTLATKPLPTVEGLLAYGRELFSIASRAQAELLQSASAQFGASGKALVLGAPAPAVGESPSHVAARAGEAANAAVHQVTDNVQAATEAIARSAQEATHVATQATTQAAQEAAAAAREAARAAAETAPPVVQATEHVVETATDNVEQATEAIAAAVAEAAPVTPAAQVDDSATAPKTARSRPAAKPVAQALAEIADKPAASLKSVPGKAQPRK